MSDKLTPRFTLEDAQRAGDAWGFNCGPGALCAVLHKTPDGIRPHLLTFEQKRYTNPTLMLDILRGLGVKFKQTHWDNQGSLLYKRPALGLMRVQWSGPWCNPGVPMAARYRHTHWVGLCDGQVFDINCMCAGGWVSWREWVEEVAPWLIKECCPKGDGRWWPTHILAIGCAVP